MLRILTALLILVSLSAHSNDEITLDFIDNSDSEAMYTATSAEECHLVYENIEDLSDEARSELFDNCEDQSY